MKEANGIVPVFLDGGVRRGTDVFKAIALGASGIFVSTVLNWLLLFFYLLHNYSGYFILFISLLHISTLPKYATVMTTGLFQGGFHFSSI